MKLVKKLTVSWLTLMATWCPIALASEALTLVPEVDRYPLVNQLLYWQSSSETSMLDEAQAAFARGAFTSPVGQNYGQIDSTRGAVWVTFTLFNRDNAQQQWILDFYNIYTAAIDGHVLSGDRVIGRFGLGASVPKTFQPHSLRNAIAELTIPSGETRTIFVRLKGSMSVSADMTLYSPLAFHVIASRLNMMYAFYYGVAAALGIYNLFLYISLRYRFYLEYLLFIGTMVLAVAAGTGSLSLLFPSFWSGWFDALSPMLQTVPVMFAIRFSQTYLRTRELSPRSHKVLTLGIVLTGFSVLMFLTPYKTAGHIFCDVVMAIYSAFIIGTAYRTYRRGYRSALYYLISWSGMLGSVVAWVYVKRSHPEFLLYGHYLPMVGQMFEMIVISLGLGDHIGALLVEKRAAELRAELGDKNRMLLRVICHDLVNPLSTIFGYATMNAQDQRLAAKSQPMWEKVLKASKAQLHIIDQVREMDGVTSGKHRLRLAPVALKPILDQLETTFEAALRAKDVKLVVTCTDNTLAVRAEANSLQFNVINNVISNAIKFSPPGGSIRVRVTAAAALVHFEVQDEGIGMPAELLAHLFDPAQPTTRPGTAGEKGTGFGMPIVKAYLEQYGAEIAVDSHEASADGKSHGTTIRIKLLRDDLATNILSPAA